MLLLVNQLPETFGHNLADYLPEENSNDNSYVKSGNQDEDKDVNQKDYNNKYT